MSDEPAPAAMMAHLAAVSGVTQTDQFKSIHDVLAMVGCDRIGRN
jgi:hypothetical protein